MGDGGGGESARHWSFWQAVRDLWCGPSFSLGWDKPGSVAPLRLVGCLIETPAPSWAYFYSTFLLPYFPPFPAQSPPPHPPYFLHFPSALITCFTPNAWQRGIKKKNSHGLVSKNSCLFFPPFHFHLWCWYLFITNPRQEPPVTGVAPATQLIYSVGALTCLNLRRCATKQCPDSGACPPHQTFTTCSISQWVSERA